MPSAHVAKEVGRIWADLGETLQVFVCQKLDSNIQDDWMPILAFFASSVLVGIIVFWTLCYEAAKNLCAKSVPHLFRSILAENLPEYSGQKCLSAEITQPTKAEITRAKYIRAEMWPLFFVKIVQLNLAESIRAKITGQKCVISQRLNFSMDISLKVQ